MSIRLRLVLQFGALLVVTLVLFLVVIYFFIQHSRREAFTQNLFNRAKVMGHAYADGQAHADVGQGDLVPALPAAALPHAARRGGPGVQCGGAIGIPTTA